MQSREVDDFLVAAKAYCDFIDSCNSFSEKDDLDKLLKVLSSLYTKGLDLPEVEPEERHFFEMDFPLPDLDFHHYNTYKEIFDPYYGESPVNGCLDDDIIDIYSDVKKGLILHEQGHRIRAIWEWKFGLEVHWGEHATSAIRALHSLKF